MNQNRQPHIEMTTKEQHTGDVPVNKTTSFNGTLSQFMHQPDKTPSWPMKRKSTPEGDRITEPEDATTSAPQTPSPSKRKRKQAQTPAASTPTNEEMPYLPSPPVTRSRSMSSLSVASPAAPTTPTRTLTPSTPEYIGRGRGRGRGRGSQQSPASPIPSPTTPSSPRSLLRDVIPPNLVLLLVGVNPGIMTGATGYAYAHPSNRFWKLLHSSGITAERHPPSDTYRLPELYSVGNTNVVERPTRDASMLSKAEMNAGVPVLESKVAAQRPEAVCLVGKGIWETVWRVRKGRAIRREEFRYGWQDESENMGRVEGQWAGAPVFVATTTSGLAATVSAQDREAIWGELGRWVVWRRGEMERERERAATGPGSCPGP
ncbi:UreE_C protein [Aspergillus sp. HF37]|nr:UreE_C protein [Aspergillus sp. HF37]